MDRRRRPPLVTRGRLASRVRMPLVAAGFATFIASVALGVSGWWALAAFALFVLGMAFYVRLGTPTGATVDLAPPVGGRWQAVNSPSTRIPSHHLHAWAQTYAVDLVADPVDGSRPGWAWWPIARRPEDYPAFGRPVLAPCGGRVVATVDAMRDHWSRSSPLGVAWVMLESVRELLGPPGLLGNHVVIRRDDGAHIVLAHLQRRSIRVERGQWVEPGEEVAACGNSGNSTEPHLHIQAMDHPSPWLAAGLPIAFAGAPPPENGDHLVADLAHAGKAPHPERVESV